MAAFAAVNLWHSCCNLLVINPIKTPPCIKKAARYCGLFLFYLVPGPKTGHYSGFGSLLKAVSHLYESGLAPGFTKE